MQDIRIVIVDCTGSDRGTTLRMIYEILCYNGYYHLDDEPGNNLDDWRNQGIVLVTPELIKEFDGIGKAYILFGNDTEKYSVDIPHNNFIYTYNLSVASNSTPLSPEGETLQRVLINRSDMLHFRYCPAFTRVTEWFGNAAPIWRQKNGGVLFNEIGTVGRFDWGLPLPVAEPNPREPGHIFVFSDGAARSNGTVNCRASYAFYLTDGVHYISYAARTPAVSLGHKYSESNNRGECLGICAGMICLDAIANIWPGGINRVTLISDSRITVETLKTWYSQWVSAGRLDKHQNVKLLGSTHKQYKIICERWKNCKIYHTRSHTLPPPDSRESEQWFVWNGNMIVDRLAQNILNSN